MPCARCSRVSPAPHGISYDRRTPSIRKEDLCDEEECECCCPVLAHASGPCAAGSRPGWCHPGSGSPFAVCTITQHSAFHHPLAAALRWGRSRITPVCPFTQCEKRPLASHEDRPAHRPVLRRRYRRRILCGSESGCECAFDLWFYVSHLSGVRRSRCGVKTPHRTLASWRALWRLECDPWRPHRALVWDD